MNALSVIKFLNLKKEIAVYFVLMDQFLVRQFKTINPVANENSVV